MMCTLDLLYLSMLIPTVYLKTTMEIPPYKWYMVRPTAVIYKHFSPLWSCGTKPIINLLRKVVTEHMM